MTTIRDRLIAATKSAEISIASLIMADLAAMLHSLPPPTTLICSIRVDNHPLTIQVALQDIQPYHRIVTTINTPNKSPKSGPGPSNLTLQLELECHPMPK